MREGGGCDGGGGRCEGAKVEGAKMESAKVEGGRWKVEGGRWKVQGARLVAMRRTVVELATEVTLGGHLQGVAPRAIAIHEDIPVVILLEAEEGASLAAGRARRACGV